MDDQQVMARIHDLVDEEHSLRNQRADDPLDDAAARASATSRWRSTSAGTCSASAGQAMAGLEPDEAEARRPTRSSTISSRNPISWA